MLPNQYFLPISGQDENGGGCYVLNLNGDIFIFNAGAKQPFHNNTLGIKRILPDTNWLNLNKSKIKGIFIGQPSTLTVDGLYYLVSNTNPYIPIYVSELGKTFIETNFNYEIYKNNPTFKFNFKIIKHQEPFYVNNHKVIAFLTSSSIPMSMGFLIKDNDGDIVIINDFIVSNDYSRLFSSDILELNKLTNNVKLLAVNVGNVTSSKSFTSPYYHIRDHLIDVISNATGRIIAALYDSDLYYLYVLASVAKQTHRPFIIYSSTAMNVFSASIRLKYFNSNNLVTLPLSEVNNSDNAIVVLVARTSELFPLLMDIINEEDKKISLKKDDLFLLLTNKIAGVEKLEADTIDAFTRSEIPVVKIPKTVLPVKASVEDQKFLIKLLKPKYIVPINGLYRNFVDYSDSMIPVGIHSNIVQYIYNGEILDLNNVKNQKEKIVINEKYVGNNLYNNEIDYQILFERERMSTDGFVNFIVLFMISDSKVSLIKYDMDLIGVVDKSFLESEKYKKINEELKTKISTYFDSLSAKDYNNKELKNSLRKIVEKYLEKQLNKKPLVLTILSQIKQVNLSRKKN